MSILFLKVKSEVKKDGISSGEYLGAILDHAEKNEDRLLLKTKYVPHKSKRDGINKLVLVKKEDISFCVVADVVQCTILQEAISCEYTTPRMLDLLSEELGDICYFELSNVQKSTLDALTLSVDDFARISKMMTNNGSKVFIG